VAIAPEAPKEVVPTAGSDAWVEETSSPKAVQASEYASVAVDIVRKPQGGMTIFRAVKKRDRAALELLLADGCDVDERGSFQNTPLLCACAEGYADIAMLLMDAKADVFAKNEQGATAIHFAAADGLLSICSKLLEHQVSVEDVIRPATSGIYHREIDEYHACTPLESAAMCGYLDIVQSFLKLDQLNKDEPDSAGCYGVGSQSVWAACRYGQSSCARALLAAKASPDFKTPEGVSCVEAACMNQKNKAKQESALAVLKVLLEEAPNGQPPDVNDTAGAPLVTCVLQGNKSAVELLLTHGCQVNVHGQGGRTALHAACERQSKDIVELLLSHRANVDALDEAGNKAYAVATRRNCPPDLVQLLAPRPASTPAGTGEPG
jgi:ankyrin repeat protein